MVIVIFLLCYTSSLNNIKESMYIDNSLNIPCTIGCHDLGSYNCNKMDKSASKVCLNPFGQNGTIRTQDLASEDPASLISKNSVQPIQSISPIPNYGISPSKFEEALYSNPIQREQYYEKLRKKDKEVFNDYITILQNHGIQDPLDPKYYTVKDKNITLTIYNLKEWVRYVTHSDSKPEWLNYYETLNPAEKEELKYYTDILEGNNINFYNKEQFRDQENIELTLAKAKEWVDYIHGETSKPDFLS